MYAWSAISRGCLAIDPVMENSWIRRILHCISSNLSNLVTSVAMQHSSSVLRPTHLVCVTLSRSSPIIFMGVSVSLLILFESEIHLPPYRPILASIKLWLIGASFHSRMQTTGSVHNFTWNVTLRDSVRPWSLDPVGDRTICIKADLIKGARWPSGLELWLGQATGLSRPGSNPTADNFPSDLWQLRLPHFASVSRRRH